MVYISYFTQTDLSSMKGILQLRHLYPFNVPTTKHGGYNHVQLLDLMPKHLVVQWLGQLYPFKLWLDALLITDIP